MPASCARFASPSYGGSACAQPRVTTRRCSASLRMSPNWNGNVSRTGSPNLLRRLIAYSDKVFHLSALLIASLTDRRPEPRISTATVAKTAMVLFWARMGSLNALEMSGASRFWKHWLGHPMPSAETMGDVHSKMDAGKLREAIHQVYGCLKSNKALPDNGGISLAIVDGHESHASYLRHCAGCLERTIHFESGDRIQYYHRQVTLLLVTGAPPARPPLRMPLDHEVQRPGEDEVATSTRLLQRVLVRYPRAFDLVLADVRGGGRGYQNGGPPFANLSPRLSLFSDHLRTFLAVKGSLRRAQQRRALDGSGPFRTTLLRRGKGSLRTAPLAGDHFAAILVPFFAATDN